MWKTTRWSQILEAQQESKQAIEKLCEDYWPSVHKFARQYCHDSYAEDFVQEFFTKFLENKWIERVSKDRGKFRTFLITAFVRFARDKKQLKQNRFEHSMHDLIPDKDINHFNRYWTENLLELVNQRMHTHYREFANRYEYKVFRTYYHPPTSSFYRVEDISYLEEFIAFLRCKNHRVDDLVYQELLLNDCTQAVHLSQILNKLISSTELDEQNQDNYLFHNIDCRNHQLFAEDLQRIFCSYNITATNLTTALNEILHNENLEQHFDVKEQKHEFRYQRNRAILEYTYPQYIEKYLIKANRKFLDKHYGNFVVPLFLYKPSYLQIAKHFEISKYQVEKAIKSSTLIYKELLRDEVSRYVCPQEITNEIRYLQNLL
ncbi:RNA polymerase sigma factor [Candidatus Uabimicrobium sp. HlEnr_7]|uniref:RNA polymerase sigma factor n=1 Tax=Candidatus Uabimicrobium helgolandensis TaxID=3095367 RepID=UPI00355629DA